MIRIEEEVVCTTPLSLVYCPQDIKRTAWKRCLLLVSQVADMAQAAGPKVVILCANKRFVLGANWKGRLSPRIFVKEPVVGSYVRAAK